MPCVIDSSWHLAHRELTTAWTRHGEAHRITACDTSTCLSMGIQLLRSPRHGRAMPRRADASSSPCLHQRASASSSPLCHQHASAWASHASARLDKGSQRLDSPRHGLATHRLASLWAHHATARLSIEHAMLRRLTDASSSPMSHKHASAWANHALARLDIGSQRLDLPPHWLAAPWLSVAWACIANARLGTARLA